MNLREVSETLGARVLVGAEYLDREVGFAFSSDLMSDVLTVDHRNTLLITGLANLQALRTAEMSDIGQVIIVRNKEVSEEMVALARENQIVLMQSQYSLFRVSGLLYMAGIKPIF
ncbi:MAG: DRTGG domain-containing protein [Bacteroidota bacterium]